MIKDSETNVVYLSDCLRTNKNYSEDCNRIIDVLDKHKIKHGFLKSTKDIWCRDYMPVQKSKNEFVQFRYEPSYLKEELKLQSNPKEVCEANNFNPENSNINLDGGNVVKWNDKVMISDRVFDENPEDKSELEKELEILLDAPVIIIPQINSDMTGHSDGYVRFYDGSTILVNELENEFKYWNSGMKKVIEKNDLKFIEIPWFEHRDKKHKGTAIGCYINYLEIQNLIILPVFEVKGNRDQETIDLFQNIYPDKIIEPININNIANEGGLMNCITWNILE